jgi:hypothetical protein
MEYYSIIPKGAVTYNLFRVPEGARGQEVGYG